MKKLLLKSIDNIDGYALNLLILPALLLTLSCKKDYRELNKGNSPLALSADKSQVVLKQKNDAADAVVFSWTTGTNLGTNTAIAYTLKIDIAGNNFSKAVADNLGKAGLAKKYTVKSLNDLLLTHWNIKPGVETTLEAIVVTAVSGNAAPAQTSNKVTIKVTAYEPVSTALYLIGDATPHGWNAGAATALTASADEPGKFTWQGPLNGGELKFITTLGQFMPSYNKGADDKHLFYRSDNSQPDDKFLISTPGTYTISLNLIDLTVSITTATTPPYKRLWMLGDATPTGWDINAPSGMRVDSSNLFVFSYNETLKAGEFKIPTSTGSFSTDYYMPLTNHPAITETGVQLVPGGNPDNKWQITNPGPYKIRLDLQNMKINIKPFTAYTQIWMVGDATPVGWNINSPQPMTPDPSDPYKFSYTGPMTAGEFKFPLATGNWGCDYFMPVIAGSGPGSTQMKFVPGGNPDNKWKLTVAGNYEIIINQLYETISIRKL
jgi:hypothetical protein